MENDFYSNVYLNDDLEHEFKKRLLDILLEASHHTCPCTSNAYYYCINLGRAIGKKNNFLNLGGMSYLNLESITVLMVCLHPFFLCKNIV
jgi:hypothetical protein